MTEIKPTESNATSAFPPPEAKAETQKARTPGMKAFDVLLYPIFNNGVVFGLSVAATYLTNRGGVKLPNGELKYGKVGEWFQKRGESVVSAFKKTGMSEDQAQMSKMVFFSFADGSVIAPFIKLFEDKRERIALWLDKRMGTTSDDLSTYEAEPKQSWASVVGGRLLTVGAVVPTAVLLDKTGLNDKLFNNPGKALGEMIEKNPNIAKKFGTLHIPELFRVGVFEAFYTSVCTLGVYAISRAIASSSGDHLNKPTEHDVKNADKALIDVSLDSAPNTSNQWQEKIQAKPPEKVYAKPVASRGVKQESYQASVKKDAHTHAEATL